MINPADDLTLLQVARELNRSLEQVRRYVREGKLRSHKLGMQWFVNRQDLKSFKHGASQSGQDDVLERIRTHRQNIEMRVGKINVIELLDRSRDDAS